MCRAWQHRCSITDRCRYRSHTLLLLLLLWSCWGLLPHERAICTSLCIPLLRGYQDLLLQHQWVMLLWLLLLLKHGYSRSFLQVLAQHLQLQVLQLHSRNATQPPPCQNKSKHSCVCVRERPASVCTSCCMGKQVRCIQQ